MNSHKTRFFPDDSTFSLRYSAQVNLLRFPRLAAAILLAALASCGGGDSQSLVVNLRTDFVPRVEFSEARVFIVHPDGREEVQSHTAANGDYARGRRVGLFENLSSGEFRARVELYAPDGRRVGQRSLAFSLNQFTNATVVITRSCAGIVCPNGDDPSATECSGGRCVPPECSPENPSACGMGDCSESGDCVAASPCVEGICTVEAACIFMPIEDACGETEYCDPTVGCMLLPPDDGGVADAGTPDASITEDGGMDAGDDAGVDAGDDAGFASCDAPCDTGNPCEVGVFDCTSGMPVCTATGAGNAGTVCRESAGPCDVAEMCTGDSTTCPDDAKEPMGTECNAAVDECDVAEVCDGTANACPLDEFQPVGTACPGGFCDASHTCSDTCVPGEVCTPTNNCRTGVTSCEGGSLSCVETGNAAEGTTCQATEFGAWGSCGSFSSTCDEAGSRSRSVTAHACRSGACTAEGSSEMEACNRDTDGASCGSVTTDPWSGCGGFGGTCDETGTRTRSVTTPLCASGTCQNMMSTETGACSRDTDGNSCGSDMFGSWSACGSFGDTCDETGSRSRSVMSPECTSGTCSTQTSTQSESCSRDTDGTSCGSVTTGGWSSCGGFSSTCDTTGSRSRSVFTPVCGSGSCMTNTSSETGSCSRSTNGNSCGSVTYGSWGSCGGYSSTCDETGSRSRSVFTPVCGSGSCMTNTSSESGSCSRDTDGNSCGSVTYGAWSACGGFTSTCDTTGTQSRSVFTPVCSAGGCSTVTSSESRSCTRSTNGSSCGSVTTGSWGPCGGFSNVCDQTGTQSRTITTPTCQSGSCNNVNSTENRSCSRSTNGNNCDNFATCQRGTCSGGSCNYSGPTCNSPNICCEPGICISPGSGCP